jgi:hypothetical protein
VLNISGNQVIIGFRREADVCTAGMGVVRLRMLAIDFTMTNIRTELGITTRRQEEQKKEHKIKC